MNDVKIVMLGDFRITKNGDNIIRKLGNSKKKLSLLRFLILGSGKSYSCYDLMGSIWVGEESINPENSLKTLVSRLRSDLAVYDMIDAIVTEASCYRWNTEKYGDIDVFAVQKLMDELGSFQKLTKKNKASMEKILTLYKGDLQPSTGSDSWLSAMSVSMRNTYMRLVYKYIEHLDAAGAYDDVARVCKQSLQISPSDSLLNMELMTDLIKAGSKDEALEHYRRSTGLHHTYHGISEINDILEYYKEYVKLERVTIEDLAAVSSKLREQSVPTGAYVCSYANFKSIYMQNVRNLKRFGAVLFVALATVNIIDARLTKDDFEAAMGRLEKALEETLRRSDTVSRYSDNQFVMLLPAITYNAGQVALERVKDVFYSDEKNAGVIINCKLEPVKL